ncbi:hypothetical protein CLOM_g6849 [Closterium sp. NIES-68]|nr:hypothetical protein CLOM_g6849 [Closterium sp. NIES-68]GJP72384.1 hypothetical protein CLOP_g3123 [Closterium sp. NIES-67]
MALLHPRSCCRSVDHAALMGYALGGVSRHRSGLLEDIVSRRRRPHNRSCGCDREHVEGRCVLHPHYQEL